MRKALYRQYRSKSFDEVIGQNHITTTLKNSLKNKSFSHAYLLTGPRGVGKTSVARILAFAVNNLDYNADAIHLDIIEIDAASNRRIEEVRNLREKINITPTSAKYKVYIIDEVHMLTREAFNALLKTLEEPPQHAIFILATTEVHKLPETIVSRCVRFTFRPIATQDIVKHLKFIVKSEKLKISGAALELIANHGEGSFRDSISLLDQIKNISGRVELDDVEQMLGLASEKTVGNILRAVSDGNASDLEESLDEAYAHGANEAILAKQIAQNLRKSLINGKAFISNEISLDLLKNLLDVPASPNPKASLELCLLTTLLGQSISEPYIEPSVELEKPSEHIDNQIENIIDEVPLDAEEIETIAIKAPKPLIDDQIENKLWDEVLLKLKDKHSTLYSIARMAEPNLSDKKLTLSFKFPFHFKRINESKNKLILTGIISGMGHNDINVDIVLASKQPAKRATEKASPDDKKNSLSTINNIFGGGEVLDS